MDGGVSVLIAVHNGASTLERAVRSALDQEHHDIEVVAVDDASTDRSWELLQDLRAQDERVVPLRRASPSGGPAAPRNMALACASGSFLALLDQDDYWLPNKLGRQLPRFEDPAVGVVYSDALISDSTRYLAQLEHLGNPPSGNALGDILRWNFIPTCTAVWRHSLSTQLGGFVEELTTVDDREYWIRAARHGFQFSYVDEPLAFYTTTGDRLSNDRARHGRLVARMWELQAAEWPDDPFPAQALKRSRRFASHIIAEDAVKDWPWVDLPSLWEAIRMCPEPRNIAKILSTRPPDRQGQ